MTGLKELCNSYQIKIPEKIYDFIENSINSERYSFENVAHWIKSDPAKYRDIFNKRELFKPQISPESIKDIPGLYAYAKALKLEIPASTMTAMENSIKNKEYSPSILANYLQGKAYQQFLQSTKVPYISEADHKQIKDSYGTDSYTVYIKCLSEISEKAGISEPVIHSIAQEYFRDFPRAMLLLNDSLRKFPKISNDKSSIYSYSNACGYTLNPQKVQFFHDINLSTDEIKAHIFRSTVEDFVKGPEKFKEKLILSRKENVHEFTIS